MIKCPLHLTDKCVVKSGSISTDFLEEKYKTNYNIDIRKYLGDATEIKHYNCNETGYRFFKPDTLAGDALFYIQLSKSQNYFQDEKWEFEQAFKWVTSESSVLEIGCGNGSFLRKTSTIAKKATGIDLTAKSVQQEKLMILNGNYNEYLSNTNEKFDLIFLFQVLEHVSDVGGIISLVERALTPKGKLIISLPNNNSLLLRDNINDILNYPPHHMGWWTPDSLKNTFNQFNFRLLYSRTEPLQKNHFDTFYFIIATNWRRKYGLCGKFADTVLYRLRTTILNVLQRRIKGHSFISVFEKT